MTKFEKKCVYYGIYDCRFPYESQCSGYRYLILSINKSLKYNTWFLVEQKHLTFLHYNLRVLIDFKEMCLLYILHRYYNQ